MVKVGILKLGNLGTSLFVHLLLDERADRDDIDVKVVGTGAKMGTDEGKDVEKLMEFDPDFVVMISPNAATPGPTEAREALLGKKPVVVISDGPSAKVKDDMKEQGFGYIIVRGDPLIGARREFLDPDEMVIFNSDVTKILAVTGAARLVREELDKLVDQVAAGKKELELPQIVVTAEKAVARANFKNPYARAKAMAAYNMAEKVAEMDVQACFVMREPERYILQAAAAHEVLRTASCLADEAREIEKGGDSVSRKPHKRSGEVVSKTELMDDLKG